MNRQKTGFVKMISLLTLMFISILIFLPCTVSASTGSARVVNQGDTPTKPTSLTAKVKVNAQNKKYVYLSWGASTDKCSGIKQYRVYRNGQLIGNALNTNYSDYKIENNGEYVYKVVAIDRNNHVSKPAESQAITINNQAPKKQDTIKKEATKQSQNIISSDKSVKPISSSVNTSSQKEYLSIKKSSFGFGDIAKGLGISFPLSSIKLPKIDFSSGLSLKKYSTSLKNYLNSFSIAIKNKPSTNNSNISNSKISNSNNELVNAINSTIKSRGYYNN